MEPEWKGSIPQRFHLGKRTYDHCDQIGLSFSIVDSKIRRSEGIKSFSPSRSQQYQFRPHIKTFHDRKNSQIKQIDYRGIKHVQLLPQLQRFRPQKAHLPGGEQTSNEINLRGIKPFQEANQSRDKHYYVESKMQRKGRIYGIEGLRNSIGLSSLGDKGYKYPQYSIDFFERGGLIVGSTHKPRKSEILEELKYRIAQEKRKINNKQKQREDERKQEKIILDSIDNWQQTILKQNNPKWNDPDTFFDRQQKQSKDNKKVGKK